MIFEMSFLTFKNANIQCAKKKLTSKCYTAAKSLPTTDLVELINKKEVAKAALDENSQIFIMQVVTLKAQLSGILI